MLTRWSNYVRLRHLSIAPQLAPPCMRPAKHPPCTAPGSTEKLKTMGQPHQLVSLYANSCKMNYTTSELPEQSIQLSPNLFPCSFGSVSSSSLWHAVRQPHQLHTNTCAGGAALLLERRAARDSGAASRCSDRVCGTASGYTLVQPSHPLLWPPKSPQF